MSRSIKPRHHIDRPIQHTTSIHQRINLRAAARHYGVSQHPYAVLKTRRAAASLFRFGLVGSLSVAQIAAGALHDWASRARLGRS